MCVWRMVGWRGMVSGPVPKSDMDAVGVWRMEKWQLLTMGLVNGVLFVFSFSDLELTVFLPSSGKESNPQDRLKRVPRLQTVVFDRYTKVLQHCGTRCDRERDLDCGWRQACRALERAHEACRCHWNHPTTMEG